jgi:serine/threonine protein kinase
MSNFKIALGKFLTGEFEFAELVAELDKELAGHPDAGPELQQLLKNLYGAGRLPQQLYEMLMQRTVGVGPGYQGGQPSGQVGTAPGSVPPPPEDDDGKTQLRPRPPVGTQPVPDDSATRLRSPGSQPGQTGQFGQPGQTGQYGQPGQTGQFGQPGQTGQFGQPGQTGQFGQPGQTGQFGQPGQTGQFGQPGQTGQFGQPGQTGQYGQPGQTGQYGQPGQTGQYGETGQTGQTGTGSSSWSNPDHWSGADSGGAPTIGHVLKGRFVLESIIGHGGMGIVFKARDLRKEEAQDRNPYLAVKILNEEFKQHPESLKALQRESRKAQDLAHPNITTVFDFDRDGGNVFMTMEYMDGEPLDVFIKRHASRGLPPDRAIPLITDMSRGLAYAHDRGIIHSDFKPANAFLTKDGTVKVFDFGIARAAKRSDHEGGEKTLFDAGTLGALTPAYATIAMIEGDEPDRRDDIYALGCVAYELFTGDHPYKKRSALKARNAGMKLVPIESLNRRQWRAMQKALAFEREKQPANIEEFIEELTPRKINKVQMIVGGVAVILLVVFVANWLPSYLRERHLTALAATIVSGVDRDIALIFDELANDLSPDEKSKVYLQNQASRQALLDYFERNIAAAIDASKKAYDYQRAEMLLSQARQLFPDSVSVAEIDARIAEQKGQEITLQSDRLDAALESETLLASQGPGSVEEVLLIVAAVQPDHPMLSDPRLPGAFARQAKLALDSKDLVTADFLVNAGLHFDPNEIALNNLRVAVDSAVSAQRTAQRIGELERTLAGLGAGSAIEDYQRVVPEIRELMQLDPAGKVSSDLARGLQSALSQRVSTLSGQRNFAGARAELESFSEVVDGNFLASQQGILSRAEKQFQDRVEGALSEIQRMAQAGQFSPPNEGDAAAKLSALESIGADEATLTMARQAIAQGYLQAARAARGAEDWDKARTLVNLGNQQRPDATMSGFLRQELADIDSAEKDKLRAVSDAEAQQMAAARAREIQSLESEFNTGLARADLTLDDGRQLVNTVDRLRGLGATGDIVNKGRDRVAEALIGRARGLTAANNWDEARTLATGLRGLFPENQVASNYAATLESEFQQYQARQSQKSAAEAKFELNRLIAQDKVDQAWLDSVIQLRDRQGADAAYLQQTTNEISAKVAKQVAALADADRFAEADALLKRAVALMPGNTTLDSAGGSLRAAVAEFNKLEATRTAAANLQALKQKVTDQANANDIKAAEATLATLKGQLAPGDVFVTQEAPRLFADAYVRLADNAARKGSFDSALDLLAKGESYVPGYAPIEKARKSIQVDAAAKKETVAKQAPVDSSQVKKSVDDGTAIQTAEQARLLNEALTSTFSSSTSLDVARTQGDLANLKKLSPSDYAKREEQLVKSAVARLDVLKKTSDTTARSYLASLQQVFPRSQAIMSYKLPAPVTAKVGGKDECGNPALAGLGSDRRGTCRDAFGADKNGPIMVVIPSGGPAPKPFAITKYEITIFDYNTYCEVSGSCTPRTDEDRAMPLTNISLADAVEYAKWLSATTGFEYRLPTTAEWEYAAEAPGTTPPKKNVNCQIQSGSELIKGKQLEKVNTGESNEWGLKNYVGNAQEWVLDGQSISARGGSFQNSYDSCEISLKVAHDGKADPITGFRLVRNITGATS